MDESATMEQLKKRVAHFRDERNWKKFHTPKDLSAAITIESSELQEIFLWRTHEEIDKILSDPEKFEHVKEEMADVAIYLLSLADKLNIDLSDAIMAKLGKNENRYPVEKSADNNKKYTEL